MSKNGKDAVKTDRPKIGDGDAPVKIPGAQPFTAKELIYIHNMIHACNHKGEFSEMVSSIKEKCKKVAAP